MEIAHLAQIRSDEGREAGDVHPRLVERCQGLHAVVNHEEDGGQDGVEALVEAPGPASPEAVPQLPERRRIVVKPDRVDAGGGHAMHGDFPHATASHLARRVREHHVHHHAAGRRRRPTYAPERVPRLGRGRRRVHVVHGGRGEEVQQYAVLARQLDGVATGNAVQNQ